MAQTLEVILVTTDTSTIHTIQPPAGEIWQMVAMRANSAATINTVSFIDGTTTVLIANPASNTVSFMGTVASATAIAKPLLIDNTSYLYVAISANTNLMYSYYKIKG